MILSSISYKGGVGKTTLTQNLAVGFAREGVKVCIIDADEANISGKWSGTRGTQSDLVPILAVGATDPGNLASTVQQLYNDYDVILIDSPPSYQPISVKIMLLSSMILIPITPTGKAEILTAIDLLDRYENAFMGREEDKPPVYFVVNGFKESPTFHKSFVEVIDETVSELETVNRFKTVIHDRIAYGEAGAEGKGVLEHHNPKAKAEILSLMNEVREASKKL